jgi:[ribosomal protein S5]-alanine N-acetyltransferase
MQSLPGRYLPTQIDSQSGRITLRSLRYRDKRHWLDLRARNREWLKPWEATSPNLIEFDPPSFNQLVRFHRREARALRSLSFLITRDNEILGQITLGGIAFGALRGGHIGYWIDKSTANQGITTEAVITLTEFAFTELKLHRIEIALRPENEASRRVAEKSGYIYEGQRPRFLHIDGQWRDHIVFVRENPLV